MAQGVMAGLRHIKESDRVPMPVRADRALRAWLVTTVVTLTPPPRAWASW